MFKYLSCIALAACMMLVMQPTESLAQNPFSKAYRAAKSNLSSAGRKISKTTKSAFKGALNKMGLRTPSDRRVPPAAPPAPQPYNPLSPPTPAGPGPTVQYDLLPPDPVVYSRLPNLQPPQPRPSNVQQFNRLVRQSPVETPVVRPAGQFQQPGNLNLVDAVSRNLYGRSRDTNSTGRNVLNRLAVDQNATRNANQSARPYGMPSSAAGAQPPANVVLPVRRVPYSSSSSSSSSNSQTTSGK